MRVRVRLGSAGGAGAAGAARQRRARTTGSTADEYRGAVVGTAAVTTDT